MLPLHLIRPSPADPSRRLSFLASAGAKVFCWASIVLVLSVCEPPAPEPAILEVSFLVYDAGETLALLPVEERLLEAEAGMVVTWVPLTPWAAELLGRHQRDFLPLPEGIAEMPHIANREGESELAYWEEALAGSPPALAVSGMVSSAQGTLGEFLRVQGIGTRGIYDGFPPPTPSSIGARVAPYFDEIWVSTERVQRGFSALGVDARVGGQPTLEAWRRGAGLVDPASIRQRLGAETHRRILTWAGQYGEGYAETLASFLSVMVEVLAVDSSALLVLSPHPRTHGEVERGALEEVGLMVPDPEGGPSGSGEDPQGSRGHALMAPVGVSTMELATVSDVVLTWASTVGTQAAFLGKQVVFFSPPEGFDTYLVDRGVTLQADPESLPHVLAEALSHPRTPERIRESLVEAGYVMRADEVVARMILEAVGRIP